MICNHVTPPGSPKGLQFCIPISKVELLKGGFQVTLKLESYDFPACEYYRERNSFRQVPQKMKLILIYPR